MPDDPEPARSSSLVPEGCAPRASRPGDEPVHIIEMPQLAALDAVSFAGTGEQPKLASEETNTSGAPRSADVPIPVARTIEIGVSTDAHAPLGDAAAESSADDLGPSGVTSPSAGWAPGREPGFAEALGLPVRCFGARVPLWGPIGALAGIAAVPGLVLALASITGITGGVIAGAARGRETSEPSMTGSASATRPTLSARAGHAGPRAAAAAFASPEMLKAIEARPAAERTPGETLLLGRSLDVQAARRIADLAHSLETTPGLLGDPKTASAVLALARDERTAMAAIELMVRLPAPLGPDLLYETWTGTAERTDATRIAQELLLSKEVRARASPALGIALDLRQLEQCGDLLPVVEQAAEQADRRAVPLLAKLERRQGCGPDRRDDCYACLREEHRVAAALDRARRTPAPTFE